MTRCALLISAALALGTGCAGNPPPDGGLRADAGGGQLDAGRRDDAGRLNDAGSTLVDAGAVALDSGAVALDSGTIAVDAGSDAGFDAGFDAGVDAGFDAGVDAGPPPSGTIDLTAGFDMTFSGDTTGGTTWLRPIAGTCPATSTSGAGTAVPRETRLIRNAGAAPLTVTVSTTSTHDGYLVIYLGTSIPSDVLMCLAGDDDDGPGANPTTTFTLPAGATAVVVATGFSNANFGPYTMHITAS